MATPPPTRPINAELRGDVLVRLKRIEGQVRGIQRMIEDCRDCRDVVTQLSAVKAAVGSLSTLLAEGYARDCLCAGETVNSEEVARLLDVLKAAR